MRFYALFGTTEYAQNNQVLYLDYINTLNEKATVVRFYNGKDNQFTVEAWIPDFYDKAAFVYCSLTGCTTNPSPMRRGEQTPPSFVGKGAGGLGPAKVCNMLANTTKLRINDGFFDNNPYREKA